MRQSWSACERIVAATAPPNIAVAGQPGTLGMTARKARHDDQHKLPNRCYGWVLERGFAWATRFRRLARDYERLAATLAALHFLAFVCLLLHRFIVLTLSP
jgi:transposase